jgi:predicted amidohydrolase
MENIVMKIAIFQSELTWENPAENRKNIERYFRNVPHAFDLFVLPEMFTTGFTMHPTAVAETMEGKTIVWLQGLAAEKNCAITGSLIITANGKYYNRMIFVFPTGEVEFYDKRHLFGLAGEDKIYTKGEKKAIVNYKGWKICLQICYDLRFPVFARNVDNYDLLIYVANWPKPRINAWDALLKARAIENMCYTVGVNRIGTDANQLEYPGHSQVFDCMGIERLNAHNESGIFCCELDLLQQNANRFQFNFLNDADRFTLD